MKVPNRNKAGRLCLPRWLNIKIWAQLERRVRSENHDQYVMIGWQSLRPNTMYSARQKIWVRGCSRLPANWRILKGGAVPISLCLPLRPCSPLQRLLLSPFDRVCCARTEMVMYLCMYVPTENVHSRRSPAPVIRERQSVVDRRRQPMPPPTPTTYLLSNIEAKCISKGFY